MKIGFIGIGNMGNSIIKGLITSNSASENEISVYDINMKKSEELSKNYGINVLHNEKEVTENSDVIILSVKPDIYAEVLEKIKDSIEKDKIIVTIAAGISINYVENIIGANKKIVRTMPNTPAQVLEGMTAVVFNKNINENEKKMIFRLLNSFGKSVELDEKLIHAFTGISGSLPAYVYMFMEALSDAGVLEGIPRNMTYEIVAQTVKGSAQMLLQSEKHPGVLKDEVTSPGGTTIEAVKVLENGNFRGTVINAVNACVKKSKKMSEK